MVVRLEGFVEGVPVVFTHKEGDLWEAVVPKKLNGIYIVEFTAYDEAGNVGFTTRYVLSVDFASLCVHLREYPYYTVLQAERYEAELVRRGFFCMLLPSETFGVSAVLSPFYASVLEDDYIQMNENDYYSELLMNGRASTADIVRFSSSLNKTAGIFCITASVSPYCAELLKKECEGG